MEVEIFFARDAFFLVALSFVSFTISFHSQNDCMLVKPFNLDLHAPSLQSRFQVYSWLIYSSDSVANHQHHRRKGLRVRGRFSWP